MSVCAVYAFLHVCVFGLARQGCPASHALAFYRECWSKMRVLACWFYICMTFHVTVVCYSTSCTTHTPVNPSYLSACSRVRGVEFATAVVRFPPFHRYST